MSDTLATLQKALTPRTGMQRIPIPLESYQHPSPPLSSKRLLNLLAEQEPTDARSQAILRSTPGLIQYITVGIGPIYALNAEMPGILYVVSGDHFYRCTFPPFPNARFEDMGFIGPVQDPSMQFTIAVGNTAAVVCSPPNAFTCGHNPSGAIGGDPMEQLGGTFPADGASSVAQMDGYFAFSAYKDPANWFICQLMDPTNFDALDFASADAMPNVLRMVLGNGGEFWMMGQAGHEVWYDAGSSGLETTPGTSFFPFRRMPGAVIPHGLLTQKSVAKADGSVWWVGNDGIVYRSNGYKAQRVSTHAIEAIIEPTDYALSYEWQGHTFYVITQANRTLIYNCATKAWHEQSSSGDGTAPWRAISATKFGGSYLLGDRYSGKIYIPGDVALDDDIQVIRQAILPPIFTTTTAGSRAFCSRVEIEMESGGINTPGPVTLEWSDDGGRTWTGGPRTMSAGTAEELRKRVYTTRLGSFRQRTFRITVHGHTTLYAVDADISPGAN